MEAHMLCPLSCAPLQLQGRTDTQSSALGISQFSSRLFFLQKVLYSAKWKSKVFDIFSLIFSCRIFPVRECGAFASIHAVFKTGLELSLNCIPLNYMKNDLKVL